mmetsp:Transcript_23780/g.61035  ORF Transcript_23780/g.61035 Transcript_23780/m.61035 type:complete len:343 (-) Transcript_23780:34-1062(-)
MANTAVRRTPDLRLLPPLAPRRSLRLAVVPNQPRQLLRLRGLLLRVEPPALDGDGARPHGGQQLRLRALHRLAAPLLHHDVGVEVHVAHLVLLHAQQVGALVVVHVLLLAVVLPHPLVFPLQLLREHVPAAVVVRVGRRARNHVSEEARPAGAERLEDAPLARDLALVGVELGQAVVVLGGVVVKVDHEVVLHPVAEVGQHRQHLHRPQRRVARVLGPLARRREALLDGGDLVVHGLDAVRGRGGLGGRGLRLGGVVVGDVGGAHEPGGVRLLGVVQQVGEVGHVAAGALRLGAPRVLDEGAVGRVQRWPLLGHGVPLAVQQADGDAQVRLKQHLPLRAEEE